jgi:hypothetical protein
VIDVKAAAVSMAHAAVGKLRPRDPPPRPPPKPPWGFEAAALRQIFVSTEDFNLKLHTPRSQPPTIWLRT